jgi:hypothetical protein
MGEIHQIEGVRVMDSLHG